MTTSVQIVCSGNLNNWNNSILRHVDIVEVAGSSPVVPTSFTNTLAYLDQVNHSILYSQIMPKQAELGRLGPCRCANAHYSFSMFSDFKGFVLSVLNASVDAVQILNQVIKGINTIRGNTWHALTSRTRFLKTSGFQNLPSNFNVEQKLWAP